MQSKQIVDILYEFNASADITLEDLAELIENEIPSVVRCKDCRHYWKNGGDNSKGAVCLASPSDDAFCSEGERKDDGMDS